MEFLKGSGVAMITPFDEEGQVDYNAVKRVVDHIISGGIDYIVLMGTTAETATLTLEERSKVVALIVEVNDNRVPLVLGIGGNNTLAVVDTIKQTDLTAFKAYCLYALITRVQVKKEFTSILNTLHRLLLSQ